jgi:hypothetical protein
MADNPPRGYSRDVRGRFARLVEDVDAESRFDPMGDSIEDIGNVSGAPSPSTIERPRHAPPGDELAQGGQWSPLRARNPVLVHPDDESHHNGILRTAVRRSGPVGMNPAAYLVGLESPGTRTGAEAEDDR